MTVISAPPPGPIADAPGHFAHTDWCEESILALALPNPQYIVGTFSTNPSGTAQVASTCVLAVNNPDPSRLMVCQVDWSVRIVSCSVNLYHAVIGSGATTIPTGAAGEYFFCQGSAITGTLTTAMTRLVTLNPGTTTLTLVSYLNNPGSSSVSQSSLRVAPVAWQ